MCRIPCCKVQKRENDTKIFGVKGSHELKREAVSLEKADTVPPNPVARPARYCRPHHPTHNEHSFPE